MPVVEGGGGPVKPSPTRQLIDSVTGKAPAPGQTSRPLPSPPPQPTPAAKKKKKASSPAPAAPAAPAVTVTGNGTVQQILDMGMGFLGVPYKWGGTDPSGFDCSGLLQYIFAKHGVRLPRVSSQQAQVGTAVSAGDAQPGDLIAFDNSSSRPGVDHIGVYLGGGKMLQAPRAGRNVEVVPVNLGRAVTIRRVLPPTAYEGLPRQGGKYVYRANATPGATSPTSITPAAGGGDIGSSGAPLDPEQAIAEFGFIAELANSVPEIKQTLEKAIKEGWTASRFQAEIQKTQWWRTTTEKQRATQLLKTNNPAEYERQRKTVWDSIVVLARNLGVELDDGKIGRLADQALSMGWSEQEVQRYVAADVKVKDSGNTGLTAVTVDSLKEKASLYGVPISQQTLQTWTTQILRGMVPAESFEAYVKEQAKSLFPGLSAAIDSGVTVRDYVDPYVQMYAQTLEVNPNGVTLRDPHIQKALYQVGRDGQRTTMNLADYGQYLRGLPAYRKTRAAQEQAAGLTEMLTETWGATA
jgi:cell wall-associated NlpC family hydrolase